MRIRRLTLLILRPLLWLFFWLWVLFILVLLSLRWYSPPSTSFMLQDDNASPLYIWQDWSEIPASLPLAVVAAEDQRFPLHYGFDFQQIQNAFSEFQSGRRLRGASTVTQQVCKNLFLWPGGGLFRKGIEAVCTLHLELLWPKRRILETYLNIAEFAPGIYGVQAASQHYFQTDVEDLKKQEAAQLVTLLPNPREYSQNLNSDYLRGRQKWVLQQMQQLGEAYLDHL